MCVTPLSRLCFVHLTQAGKPQLDFKFSLLRPVVVTPVLPVRDVLRLAVVVEVTALAEGCEVGGVVIHAIAVEVGDGEDDFHRAVFLVDWPQ